ncbi:hypothetical protein Pmani_014832 [Petrolisthes manimaculis]|uniref:RNA-directed DNA polymerase n=1 Tax=Petrolisthes manimaculis TaxID=1843537 RepID=A0AAE1PS51_9EUCA|nr:hypothetical protein Pmani_014832 [Petrolisthes manimaculis]
MMEILQSQGAIEKSSIPWTSAVVLARKKDGSVRCCVDYRVLNEVTVKNTYPLPRIDDTLDALLGAKWFSTLDMKAGYYQVKVAEKDREKTAFSYGQSLWQFKGMSFGLCNAPSYIWASDGSWQTAFIYLDDVIIFGQTFDQELRRLPEVFNRFRAANLKLNPKKCHSFQKEVKYLRHIAGENGVHTYPEKVSALLEKRKKFKWTEVTQKAFDELKQALVSSKVLPYPEQSQPFILDCDASDHGIGGVLTNHAALKWLKTLKNPEGQLAHRVRKIDQHNYEVQQRPGLTHGNADSLSRRPCEPECKQCSKKEEPSKKCNRTAVTGLVSAEEDLWNHLRLNKGLLERQWETPDSLVKYWQLVVPKKFRSKILNESHNQITSEHLGLKKMLSRLRQRFYWMGMR